MSGTRTHNTEHTKTQQQTPNNYEVKLRGCLVTLKHTVNKLPPNKVWPDLHLLITPIHNALALATKIVRGRMKVELTGILKEDLLKTSKIATKLIVPDGKREKSTYSGLRKVRRLLTESTRIAAKLHEDVSSRGDSLYNSHCTIATSSTPNVSTHWKPSLNCPFFLKPSTLTFKGMTAECAQSLAAALAKQNQSLRNNADNIVSKQPAHKVNYGATCRDLKNALQSVTVQPNKSASKEPASKPVCKETPKPVVSGDDKHVLLIMAIKIKNRLTRVQSDSSKLSSSVEAQSLDMLKQSLDSVKQLVEDIISKPVSTKMTGMLKSNLQSTLTLVNKLHDSCSKTDQVGVRVLSRLRCILDMCGRMATNLHVQIEVTLKSSNNQSSKDQLQSKPAHSSSTQAASTDSVNIKCQPAIQTAVSTTHAPSTHVQTDKSSNQPMERLSDATTVETTHWKPSMNRKFFLKSPTLVFKGMTKENLQSLAVALAADAKSNSSNNSNADVDMKQSNDINYDNACKDLSDALQSTVTKSKLPAKVQNTRVPLTLEEKRQASKRLANKISLCLIAVQRELSRLSPKAVRPNLDDLKIAVDNTSSLATVVCRSMRIEMTSLLQEDLQDAYKTAKKLRVPANKKEQSTSRGLSRAKRLLEVGVRMADALHKQIMVVFVRKAPTLLSSKPSPTVHCSSAKASSVQKAIVTTTTTETSTLQRSTVQTATAQTSTAKRVTLPQVNSASQSSSIQSSTSRSSTAITSRLNVEHNGQAVAGHVKTTKPHEDFTFRHPKVILSAPAFCTVKETLKTGTVLQDGGFVQSPRNKKMSISVSQAQNLPKTSFRFSPPKCKLKHTLSKRNGRVMRKTHLVKPDMGTKTLALKQSDKRHCNGSPSTGLQVKHSKTTFATELVSVAEEKTSAGRFLVRHQPISNFGNNFKTTKSRKKTLKPNLKHARRLKTPYSVKTSVNSDNSHPVGVKLEVTITDDDDDTQPEIIPRITLGKVNYT